MGDDGQRVQSCCFVGWLSSRELMYNMITVDNNVFYTENF